MSQQPSNFLNMNYRYIKTVYPTTLQSNSYFTNTSESIAQFMVEKIISFTMTHLVEKAIEQEIPSFCFIDVKKAIDPYIQISFIPYDHDDLGIPLLKENIHLHEQDNKKPELFHSNIEHIEIVDDNNQSHNQSISKPTSNMQLNAIYIPNANANADLNDNADIDVNVNANVTTNANTIFYDNVYAGVNNWDIPLQPKSVFIDRDASTVIPYEKLPLNENNINKEDDNQSVSTAKKDKQYYSNAKNKKKKSQESVKKKKGQPPLEIVAYDLPKELIFNVNETDELAQMRIDREREIIQREVENRRKKKKAEENLEKMNENAKKQKEFEYKNITVDSNGAIIFIKDVQPELFPIEFRGLSSTTKEVQLIKAEPIKLPAVAPSKNKGKLQGNMNQSPERDREKEKEREREKEKTSSPKKNPFGKVVPVMNVLAPERKGDLKEEKLFREKFSIQPSGSAFDSIKLEVGVVLHEETKYKTGGKDFYKKYKKYSVENFQTTQSKTDSLPFQRERKTDNSKKDIDDKNTKTTEPEVNYVMLNTEPGSTIKVLNVKTKSLRNAIDKLDLISEEQEKEAIKRKFNRTRPGDMYKKTKMNSNGSQLEELLSNNANSNIGRFNNTQTTFNEMNQFAKTIVSNQAWGTNPLKFKPEMNQNAKVPIKPMLNDIMKELPGGIVHTKMPRARRYAYLSKENNSNKEKDMNNTTSTKFFKVVKNTNSKYKPELTQTEGFKPKGDPFVNNTEKEDKNNSPFSKTVGNNLYKD